MSRFKSVVCADLIIRKKVENKDYILLIKRINSKYNNNEFELPGGHLEQQEDVYDAVIRELKEELLIKIKRKELKLIHLMHHYNEERLNFIFEIEGSKLKPKIGEPNKCGEIKWFQIDKLPKNISPKLRRIIKNVINNKFYDKL